MNWLLKINWLGIDVALGAGALSYAMGHAWNVDVPFSSIILLILVVWLIYAADHLRDASANRQSIRSPRRLFHAGHYSGFVTAAVLAGIAAAILLLIQPAGVLAAGTWLTVLVLAYFIILHFLPPRFSAFKEPMAALFYTLGVCLLPHVLADLPAAFLIHLLQVFILAFANLLIFSWFDFSEDMEEGFHGSLSMIGTRSARIVAAVLLSIQLILAFVLILLKFQQPLEFCFILMSVALALPVIFPRFWAINDRFRIVGDAIFFLPLLVLLDGRV